MSYIDHTGQGIFHTGQVSACRCKITKTVGSQVASNGRRRRRLAVYHLAVYVWHVTTSGLPGCLAELCQARSGQARPSAHPPPGSISVHPHVVKLLYACRLLAAWPSNRKCGAADKRVIRAHTRQHKYTRGESPHYGDIPRIVLGRTSSNTH